MMISDESTLVPTFIQDIQSLEDNAHHGNAEMGNGMEHSDELDEKPMMMTTMANDQFPYPFNQIFRDEIEAMTAFRDYALNHGFTLRKDKVKVKDDRVKYRSYVCSCAGFPINAEPTNKCSIRCGCKFRITIWRQKDGCYKVTTLINDHNHAIANKDVDADTRSMQQNNVIRQPILSGFLAPKATLLSNQIARKRYANAMAKAKQLCVLCCDDDEKTQAAMNTMDEMIKQLEDNRLKLSSGSMDDAGRKRKAMEMEQHHHHHQHHPTMASVDAYLREKIEE